MIRIFALVISFVITLNAWGNLVVYPTRVTLSKQENVGKLTLKFTGNQKTKFHIKTVYYQQTPDGRLIQLDSKSEPKDSAAQMIRFSPRSVTLEPGEVQVVRIMSKRRIEAANGEYRVHVLFESAKQDSPDKKDKNSSISTNLVINMGVAIPVIYRHLSEPAQAKLKQVSINKGKEQGQLSFVLNREGEGGTYSRIFLTKKNQDKVLFELKGLSTYLDEVTFRYLLPKDFDLNEEYDFHLWNEEKNKEIEKTLVSIR